MPFDYKKEYPEYYLPPKTPQIIEIPEMKYISVNGKGDPNEEDGEYKRALELLYGIAFTLKMSKKTDYVIDGYFDYVVPPLEGFWLQEGIDGIDYSRKCDFRFTSVIRVPDFVKEDDFRWAVSDASRKKKKDFSKVEFITLKEGLSVQCMHTGPYDAEPETVRLMDAYIRELGYVNDFSEERRHHEIYLSDPRRTVPEKLRTVIRHPIRKRED